MTKRVLLRRVFLLGSFYAEMTSCAGFGLQLGIAISFFCATSLDVPDRTKGELAFLLSAVSGVEPYLLTVFSASALDLQISQRLSSFVMVRISRSWSERLQNAMRPLRVLMVFHKRTKKPSAVLP